MDIYIAGRITGDPDFEEKFNIAKTKFRVTDHVLLPTVLPKGMLYQKYIPICLAMINAADKIAMLPDWKESAGARLEHEYARLIAKPVIYL